MLKVQLSNMRALVALRRYQLGDTVFSLKGNVVDRSTRTSIRIAKDKHIEDINGAFINHSCLPNTVIVNGDVVATRHVAVGEELTFNYLKNEETPFSNPFVCFKCNTYIGGEKVKDACPIYRLPPK